MLNATFYHGDCLEKMRLIPDNSVDAIVTDPPAGISFMGAKWDGDKGGRRQWVAWMSEVAKECLRIIKPGGHALVWSLPRTSHWTGTAWDEAGWEVRDKIYHAFAVGFPKSLDMGKKLDGWEGWGTALRPSCEEWALFRKPFNDVVAENVRNYGTGAINIDACRIYPGDEARKVNTAASGIRTHFKKVGLSPNPPHPLGRWPANFIHDGSQEILKEIYPASPRFFYCHKNSKKDGREEEVSNHHPTAKVVELMRYLCRLITPPTGIILDPFMGSGSTGKAAILEGFNFIGIEQEEEYFNIAKARVNLALEAIGQAPVDGAPAQEKTKLGWQQLKLF